MLLRESYTVFSATDPEEALPIAEEHEARIDLPLRS